MRRTAGARRVAVAVHGAAVLRLAALLCEAVRAGDPFAHDPALDRAARVEHRAAAIEAEEDE